MSVNTSESMLAQTPRSPRGDREHLEQRAVMKWAELAHARYPELALLHAIPNGGHRHRSVAGRLRAEGVRAGVPDLCLPVAHGGAHGLYIEMKAPGGRESPAQRWWRERLLAQGYCHVVCVGAGAAIEALSSYLAKPPTTVALHPACCFPLTGQSDPEGRTHCPVVTGAICDER